MKSPENIALPAMSGLNLAYESIAYLAVQTAALDDDLS
jgi:hypothetical protein